MGEIQSGGRYRNGEQMTQELTSPEDQAFDQILYEALSAKVGLLIEPSDATRCRQKFYRRRAILRDPQLSRLQIVMAPEALRGEGSLVICRAPAAAKPFKNGPSAEDLGL